LLRRKSLIGGAIVAPLLSLVAAGTAAGESPTTAGLATAAVVGTSTPGYSDGVQADSLYPGRGDANIDVLSYDLNLHWYPSAHKLNGVATEEIRPLPAAVTAGQFKLILASNLSISSITVDGHPVSGTRSGPTVWITPPLTTVMSPADSMTVVIAYSGKPASVLTPTSRTDMGRVGWHNGSHGSVWTMQEPFGAFTWYPVSDQPSDKAMYTLRVNVPDTMIGISNGKMTHRNAQNGRQTTSFTNAHPMASYLVTLAIGNYRKATQTGPNGVPITYWFPEGTKARFYPVLSQTPKLMSWLASRLGAYPFESAGVVIVPSRSAVETQSMITFGSGIWRQGSKAAVGDLVHELAHSWYGDSVTPSDWKNVWMNEGMAMYLQAKYTIFRGWHSQSYWTTKLSQLDYLWRGKYGPPGNPRRTQFAQINVYYPPALMWTKLAAKVGPTQMAALIKQWPVQHKYTSQTRAAYVDWLAGNQTKVDASWFDKWLDSTTTPSS